MPANQEWPVWAKSGDMLYDLTHRVSRVDWPQRRELTSKLRILHRRRDYLLAMEVEHRRQRKVPQGHGALIRQWCEDLQYLDNEITWQILAKPG